MYFLQREKKIRIPWMTTSNISDSLYVIFNCVDQHTHTHLYLYSHIMFSGTPQMAVYYYYNIDNISIIHTTVSQVQMYDELYYRGRVKD